MVTIRMPEVWREKVSDRQLVSWLRDYAQSKSPLPRDPGPGPFKRSFRLENMDPNLIDKWSDGEASSFLRRLIALHLSLPATPVLSPPKVTRTRSATASPQPKQQPIQPPKPSPSPSKVAHTSASLASANPKEEAAAIPRDMPDILCRRCPENHFSPMWQNDRWVREPLYPEERSAFEQLLRSRMPKIRSK